MSVKTRMYLRVIYPPILLSQFQKSLVTYGHNEALDGNISQVTSIRVVRNNLKHVVKAYAVKPRLKLLRFERSEFF